MDFSESFMLTEVVLHVATQEVFEELSLLSNEVSCACRHLAQPGIQFMLIIASGHSDKFTELLEKLVHLEHGRGQCLTFFINIFSTFNNLIVQGLVSVNEIDHFTAENSTIRHHLPRNLS